MVCGGKPQGTLFTDPLCPFCQRVLIAAKHHGISIKEQDVGRPRPAWFLKLNSSGQVPVYREDGNLTKDSLDILVLFDAKGNESKKLLPSGKKTMAKDLDKVGRCLRAVRALVLSSVEGKNQQKRAEKNFFDALTAMERLHEGPFYHGNLVSAVDFAMWGVFERLDAVQHYTGVQMLPDKYPMLTSCRRVLAKQPAVKKYAWNREKKARFIASFEPALKERKNHPIDMGSDDSSDASSGSYSDSDSDYSGSSDESGSDSESSS
eukprot:TRINITY_DN20566_c0_g1_i1.p1 TRINITY_DN20566_c0_g1~~TRINITY_DN20566_c0_g1_i1.p1  ORF type:complete len:275 (-),score=67.75 TRINITY_DN20566_c0_g1_i1:80-868(-)